MSFLSGVSETSWTIEVKSGKDYYTHSAIKRTVSNGEYGVEEAYVFALCNIEKQDKITYFPAYMAAFITDEVDFPDAFLTAIVSIRLCKIVLFYANPVKITQISNFTQINYANNSDCPLFLLEKCRHKNVACK